MSRRPASQGRGALLLIELIRHGWELGQRLFGGVILQLKVWIEPRFRQHRQLHWRRSKKLGQGEQLKSHCNIEYAGEERVCEFTVEAEQLRDAGSVHGDHGFGRERQIRVGPART